MTAKEAHKLAVITGNRGLGLEAASLLAAQGWDLLFGGRDPAHGIAAVARIAAEAPGVQAEFLPLDLASLASIAAFAEQVTARGEPIGLLVNNAGVMSPPQRLLTADGMELQFGVNYLGHFALTAHLLPLLRKAESARVVNVTSIAHKYGDMDLDDLQAERSYHPGIQYCRSKLAQALFSQELQRRSVAGGWGIASVAAHPGFARTNLFSGKDRGGERMGPLIGTVVGHILGHSARGGALSLVHASTSPEDVGGALYGPAGLFEMRGRPVRRNFSANACNKATAAALWDLSEQLVGVTFPG